MFNNDDDDIGHTHTNGFKSGAGRSSVAVIIAVVLCILAAVLTFFFLRAGVSLTWMF